MRLTVSNWINLGFLLGLAVVTSITLPDHPQSNAKSASEDQPRPAANQSQPSDASKTAEPPALLMLASLPKPSPALRQQAERVKEESGQSQESSAQDQEEARMTQTAPAISTMPERPVASPSIKPMRSLSSETKEAVVEKQATSPLIAMKPQEPAVRPATSNLTPMTVSAPSPAKPILAMTPMAADPVDAKLIEVKQARGKALAMQPVEMQNPSVTVLNSPSPTQSSAERQDPVKPVATPDDSDFALARRQIDDGGAAPSLEFLWPANASSHQQIYHTLTHCLGMLVGHIDDQGTVTLASGQGVKSLNRQLHSPLLRSLERPVTGDEADAMSRLGRSAGAGHFIRVFRRDTDVTLLAGLHRLTHSQNQLKGAVSAEYFLAPDGLYLDQITHNGVALPGRILLYRGRCI